VLVPDHRIRFQIVDSKGLYGLDLFEQKGRATTQSVWRVYQVVGHIETHF
jgi:hypothetical protein